MLKRLFALLAILGIAIAVVVGRKRSPDARRRNQ